MLRAFNIINIILQSSKMVPFIIINLLSFLLLVSSRTFFHSVQKHGIAYYQCFQSSGSDRIGLGLQYSLEQVDQQSMINIYNARNAGLYVEASFAPFRCRKPDQEFQFLIKNVDIKAIDKFWMFLALKEEPECSWKDYSPASNCQYLQIFVDKMIGMGLKVGIAVDKVDWMNAFQSLSGCQQASKLPLWWIPDIDEYDKKPNFDSYHQIGGWKVPHMKLLGEKKVCGKNLYQNYLV